eukprot:NODE_4562_length_661_cov_316.377888.p2 GENE.NODE_4562_length_661_cov_316.377888~~NODE_4562_length_661_cov_316.377888.p2  ORF type:complete len:181 (+),score=73.52 NODE_4562_length_661_cov_316.377888:64-543(+)
MGVSAVKLSSSSKTANVGKQQVSASELREEKATLEKLYKQLKKQVVGLTKQDTQLKAKNQQNRQDAEKHLEHDREELRSGHLSAYEAAVLANQTQWEERELKYWSKDREFSHRSYHANLKVTHGLMSHVKDLLGAYDEAIEKGKPSKKTEELLGQGGIY